MATPPVRSSDLIPYWSRFRATDDTSLVGGAIDTTMRVVFNDLTPGPSGVLEVVSSSPQDITQTITLTVLQSTGLVVSQTLTMQGLLPITFDSLGDVNRVESAVMSGAPLGNVTIRLASNHALLTMIPAGEIGFRRMFEGAVPSATAVKTYYEKFFWLNRNTTTAVTSATVVMVADPTGEISHCLASAVNDAGTTTNRITRPDNSVLAAPYLFDDTTQNVPGGAVPAQGAIGVWVSLTLQPAPQPMRSSFTSQLLGATPS